MSFFLFFSGWFFTKHQRHVPHELHPAPQYPSPIPSTPAEPAPSRLQHSRVGQLIQGCGTKSKVMPLARNLEESPPSLLQAAEVRRQRVKLVGWLFFGLIVFFALFSVLSWTVWEVLGLFVGVPRTRAVKDKSVQERGLPSVASDKVRACCSSWNSRISSAQSPGSPKHLYILPVDATTTCQHSSCVRGSGCCIQAGSNQRCATVYRALCGKMRVRDQAVCSYHVSHASIAQYSLNSLVINMPSPVVLHAVISLRTTVIHG